MLFIYDTLKQGSCFKTKLKINERVSLLTRRALHGFDTRVYFLKRDVLHKRYV